MTLKVRLAISYSVILATLLLAMVALATSQRDDLVAQVDSQLLAAAPILAAPPPVPFPGLDIDDPRLEQSVSDLYVARISDDGAVQPIMVGELIDDAPTITLAQLGGIQDRVFVTLDGAGTDTRFRAVVLPSPDGGWAMAALPLTATERTINQLLITLGVVTAIIAVVLGLSALWVIRLGIGPIGQVTDAADRIAAGDTHHRVTVKSSAIEASRLAGAFNVMLDDRDENETKLRRFVADASHELRTPLTSMRGYLDIYAGGGFTDEAQLREAMVRMRYETRRMGELVEDLLLLANLDQGRPLETTEIDVVEVLGDAASDARAMDATHEIEVVPVDHDRLVVHADDMRLRQAVAAILHNAVVHTPPGTHIAMSAARDEHRTTITISDDGPGLEPEVAARIFDRFYRGDPARTRHRGGSELGLAIASSLVEAQGGDIELDTAPGQGCRFHVHLPSEH